MNNASKWVVPKTTEEVAPVKTVKEPKVKKEKVVKEPKAKK